METSGRQRGAARKRRCRLFDLHTKQNISLRGWTEAGRCLELRQYSLQFTLNKEANKVCFQCIYSQTKTNGYGYNMFFTKVLCPAFTIMCTYTDKNHVFAPLPFFLSYPSCTKHFVKGKWSLFLDSDLTCPQHQNKGLAIPKVLTIQITCQSIVVKTFHSKSHNVDTSRKFRKSPN